MTEGTPGREPGGIPGGRRVRPALVARTEMALRTFGAVSREQAQRILPVWVDYHVLTEYEEAAVLERFRPQRKMDES